MLYECFQNIERNVVPLVPTLTSNVLSGVGEVYCPFNDVTYPDAYKVFDGNENTYLELQNNVNYPTDIGFVFDRTMLIKCVSIEYFDNTCDYLLIQADTACIPTYDYSIFTSIRDFPIGSGIEEAGLIKIGRADYNRLCYKRVYLSPSSTDPNVQGIIKIKRIQFYGYRKDNDYYDA